MKRNKRPNFHRAVELCNAIGDAGGFDYYDDHDLEPPPLYHFEALLDQGYSEDQIKASVLVPAMAPLN